MVKPHIATIGKVVRHVTRLRGGGSAFPGLVIEKIDPGFTRDVLASLPYGIVVISGTNGKTTTTKMTVELLESQGFKVFTNRTGSNFARGVTAAILADIDYSGKLDADIAVLELDEAHGVKFVDIVPPRYSLLLNVMRDQLDRFERSILQPRCSHISPKATTRTVVLNREDPRIVPIAATLFAKTTVEFFGLSRDLRAKFPSDDDMRGTAKEIEAHDADVILKSFSGNRAVFRFDNSEVAVPLKPACLQYLQRRRSPRTHSRHRSRALQQNLS